MSYKLSVMRSKCKKIALPHFLEYLSLRRATDMSETNFAPFLFYITEPVFHLVCENVPAPLGAQILRTNIWKSP